MGIAEVRRSQGYHVAVGVGLVSYGLLHVVLAWLTLQVAFGRKGARHPPEQEPDDRQTQPFGAVADGAEPALLVFIALGIACFGVYCLVWARHARY